ncbi:MAG: translation initiation factor IF-2 [Armatimonadetes bacterium]|nr:translation initiation factor IF-2 [Armatimonadota bacterium]
MIGTRVSDLSNELEMSVAELQAALSDLGVYVAGPAAIVEDAACQILRETYGKGTNGKVVEVTPNFTLRELATAFGIQAAQLQKKAMDMGVLVAVNQRLDQKVADSLASVYGYKLRIKTERKPITAPMPHKHRSPGGGPQPRPPVVTIMGHVDHGKTTLLDAIRHTNVVEGEFGGITQHIGAYQIELDHQGERRRITFLDTPGHEAFTAMRARGASVTDIAVLVVAADDGIMPQTIEAADHAQAAGVSIIVAINKIDKPGADPERIKTQLTNLNLVPEEYGGDTICVPVSAKQRKGIDNLLEYILLLADVLDLKADPHGLPVATIIEAQSETGRGPVATALVREGTLRIGDAVVAGLSHGKIRAMMNDRGERLNKATPAMPVEILGLSVVPAAGDVLQVVRDERIARQTAEQRQQVSRLNRLQNVSRVTLQDLYQQIREGAVKDLNLIVKGDVQGSVEAVVGALNRLEVTDVRLHILHSGVGNINESDILLASASNAIVIGFNVKPETPAAAASEREHIDVRSYQIIYELTADIEKAMKGLLEPVYEEVRLGRAEVRRTFRTPKGVVIAGCYVMDGKIVRGANARVIRGDQMIYTGKVESLRHIKDDVKEIAQGFECGIVVDDYAEYESGDIIESFEMQAKNL